MVIFQIIKNPELRGLISLDPEYQSSDAMVEKTSFIKNSCFFGKWLRGLDLNQRPSGYEPDELPSCSTPRP